MSAQCLLKKDSPDVPEGQGIPWVDPLHTFRVIGFTEPILLGRGLPPKRRHQIIAVLSCTSAVEMSGSLTGRIGLQSFRWIS